MIIVDAQTWLLVAQDDFDSSQRGIWRTTTAGRKDGVISPDAWIDVHAMPHFHGSMSNVIVDGVIYLAGRDGILRSRDRGATWTNVCSSCGYMSGLVATNTYLYADFMLADQQSGAVKLLRARRDADTQWDTYTNRPAGLSVGAGASDMALDATFDGQRWYLLSANFSAGLWRYCE
ncbi:MAG: hypothetical protein SFV15_25610 [Polyangiaceae bacterium]|nr:hypothetical protein [Polyangiaceae bacterium]